MAHDPNATPVEVLRRYQREVWNAGDCSVLPEIVANPYRRHYPGKVEEVTNEDLAERVRFYRRGLRDVCFRSVLEVCEGPYVTTAWETLGTTPDGRRLATAGIEIFKVENGRITDVWNGHPHDGQWAWNLLWNRPVAPEDTVDVKERVRSWGRPLSADPTPAAADKDKGAPAGTDGST